VAGGAAHDTLSMSRVAWECSPKLVVDSI